MLSGPEPLTDAHDVSLFSCGKPALDDWLKSRALSNQRHGFTAVMVVQENQRVVGYYGLAPTGVEPRLIPRTIKTGQQPSPVPCVLLGQLATDRNWAGKGIAGGLLRHASARSLQAALLIGGRALVVRAIDSEAAAYWRRRGFSPSKDDALLLFQSFANVAASLKKAAER